MEKGVIETNTPMRVLVGWAEGVSKDDAIDLARGFIQRRFDAVDASWYAIAPFLGGFFWEVQEGGKGKSYMPAIMDALTNDPGSQHWLPSGDRAFQVMMRDGKPFGVLLQKSESKKVIESGIAPLRASGKMKAATFKGTSVLYAGSGLMAAGVAFFVVSAAIFALSATPEPATKDFNLAKLPIAQWGKLETVQPTEIVSKLQFEKGDWRVEKRPFDVKGLKKAEPKAPNAGTVPPAPTAPSAMDAIPAPADALSPTSPDVVPAAENPSEISTGGFDNATPPWPVEVLPPVPEAAVGEGRPDVVAPPGKPGAVMPKPNGTEKAKGSPKQQAPKNESSESVTPKPKPKDDAGKPPKSDAHKPATGKSASSKTETMLAGQGSLHAVMSRPSVREMTLSASPPVGPNEKAKPSVGTPLSLLPGGLK